MKRTAIFLCAALAAEGESIVHGSEYVERGYEKIEDAFSFLGGSVRLQGRKEEICSEKKQKKTETSAL